MRFASSPSRPAWAFPRLGVGSIITLASGLSNNVEAADGGAPDLDHSTCTSETMRDEPSLLAKEQEPQFENRLLRRELGARRRDVRWFLGLRSIEIGCGIY
ncbi:hypothetical protein DL766_008452 [Monosporascus sp. MC13-8B]|uniref:Uncharacterized protein n=1 Tax=Monosporascus cannonballus TaxID=155416 RepID=A0ABY0GTJ1_9PEZI|nr:hypothetical protein DL762_009373 [Monosporascus cannonballus]RYO77480.1 hypothetical protein DL763_009968 [Monosporascus cannonballus]RYP19371.1 hypothetical protein DL766_008452 [Monosporascus sp. MC13-8B]